MVADPPARPRKPVAHLRILPFAWGCQGMPGGVRCCPAGTGKHRPTTVGCAEYVPKIGMLGISRWMTSTCPTGASPSPGIPSDSVSSPTGSSEPGSPIAALPGRTPLNQHILISEKTALGAERVSQVYLKWNLCRHGVSVERIRRDRVLHEELAARLDPLHLALVFNLSHTTASR